MSGDLKDVTIALTGAGRGLGAALAITLSDEGANLILCGRSPQALGVVADQIGHRTRRQPTRVMIDLADSQSVETGSQEIMRRHPVIDVLINNGAAWLEHRASRYSSPEVAGVIGSAVTGTFLLTQALMPALERSPRPDVVTIGSTSGLPNAPLRSASVPFYAAKHAQAALADGLRQALAGTPVRSICIHPPYLDDVSPLDAAWDQVPQRPKGARATNRDVVEAVVFAVTRPRHVTIASLFIDSDKNGLHRYQESE